MKKTSFLKKLTAMAATLAMTCVMAVGAFAAEPAVDYKLDSASISVGETWTMSVPAGGMYDWNLSSEYIAYGPSMADKEGVLKQVGYETANGVSTITYEAMMPGTCTVTLTDRSFAKIAEATVTVTDGSAAPDTPSVDTPSTDNKVAETPAASSAVTSKTITSRLRIWLCRVCLFRAAYKRASQRDVSGYFRFSSAGDGVCASSWSISARNAISRAALKKIFVSFVSIVQFLPQNFPPTHKALTHGAFR